MKNVLSAITLTVAFTGCQQATPQRNPSARDELSVHHYGAVGDGKTVDTPAINHAIAAAGAAGGGIVYFPAGRYLCGSIHLQSNVTLYLGEGAIIQAADRQIAPSDPPEPRPAEQTRFQDFGHSHFQNSLIWGEKLQNVAILGPGLIDGKGLESGVNPHYDRTKGEKEYGNISNGAGDKAISLRECQNVTLRDFSILHGGWFGILATGVNNLTIDHLKVDTNRDGMDIDACSNVRISNTSVNSPWDDGICLKSTFALGHAKACENITISNCFLSGNFDEGTLIDGSFQRSKPEYKSFRTGRIKLGTESNGDFTNIAITNCVFDDCRGIAIESVDGAHIEDVTISNITMRHVANPPLFVRLGARLRGPKESTVVGTIRRINVSNITASGISHDYASIISGLPDHPIEDIHLSNLTFVHEGGGTQQQADRVPPEREAEYPEPSMFGATPAYGFFVRHARNVQFDRVSLKVNRPESRPAFSFTDASDVSVNLCQWDKSAEGFSLQLREACDVKLFGCPALADRHFQAEAGRF